MKSLIVVALFVAAAAALPAAEKEASILSYDSDNIGVDKYRYQYKTSNGIETQEEGQLKNVGTENEALEVRGAYQYQGPDGVVYTLNYVANENGFQAFGAHLPQPPQ